MNKDKNNNLHATKTAMKDANVAIDADHVLKTVFMQDDTARSMLLNELTMEHVTALEAYVALRDKKRKVTTEAVEKKETF